MKYFLLYYDKYLVNEIHTFDSKTKLKEHLITLLQYPPINNVENLSLKDIYKHVNERWNYSDGDFWRLLYQLENDGVGRIVQDDTL